MGTTPQANITIGLSDLENLIRRVVREELTRMRRTPSLLDDWSHEAPADPAGDEAALHEALPVSERYRTSREGWKTLEEFEAEFAKSEGQT